MCVSYELQVRSLRRTLIGFQKYSGDMSEIEGEAEEDVAYADDLPLVELFGDGARARMLAVFATRRERELSLSELARQAGIARPTVYDYIDEFVELGIVREVDAGQGSRYTTNKSNAVAEKLYELNGVTLRELLNNRDDVEFED